MNIADFQPGQVVQLDIKADEITGSFEAKVSLVYKTLLLLEPIYVNGKLVGFPKTCSVDLTYTVESIFYVWKNVSIQTIIFKNHHYHAVELVGDAEAMNRRNNFRVYIGEDMPISYFTDQGPKTITSLIKDISETGFAFITKETFHVDRTVRLNIPQPDRTMLHISAKIVREVPMENPTRTLYGCQFLERNPKLSNYLMRLQRQKQKDKLG